MPRKFTKPATQSANNPLTDKPVCSKFKGQTITN